MRAEEESEEVLAGAGVIVTVVPGGVEVRGERMRERTGRRWREREREREKQRTGREQTEVNDPRARRGGRKGRKMGGTEL